MRDELVLAAAQPLCVPYDVASNASTHAETVRAARASVVVFPELSLTGYQLDAPTITMDDPRLQRIVEACAQSGSTALVGAPVPSDSGRPNIAMLAIDGDGSSVAYRKLWVSTEESQRFDPGDRPAVLEIAGWRLGLAICRDTGIAQHWTDTAALGMDVYVGATLMTANERVELEDRACRIAAEHHVWIAFASFAGPTGSGYDNTAGCSGIWTSAGVLLNGVGDRTGEIARATLS